MLIPSPRHSPADLILWSELESGDFAYPIKDSIIEKTLAEIADWSGDYIGVSWGKDSVVMLSLVHRAGLNLPVVWVRMRGRDNPDCEAVRDAFLGAHTINYFERTFEYDECNNDEHWRSVEKEFGERRMTGIRADESGARKMSIRHLGSDTGKSFRPIAWWTLPMIFAYLAQCKLPVHPAYAMLGGGRWPREHLRTHGIGGNTATNRGRREWEMEYYGDVLNRIKKPKPATSPAGI